MSINNANSHSGQNWPYHENSNTGEMVPCANNPCSLHGDSDVYATSPEEAYAKKYADNNASMGFKANSKHETKDNLTRARMLADMTENDFTDEELNGFTYNGNYGCISLAYDKIREKMNLSKSFQDDGQFSWETPDGIDIRLQTNDDYEDNKHWFLEGYVTDKNNNDIYENDTEAFKDISFTSGYIRILKKNEKPRAGFNQIGGTEYIPAKQNIKTTLAIIHSYAFMYDLIHDEMTDENSIADRYAKNLIRMNKYEKNQHRHGK